MQEEKSQRAAATSSHVDEADEFVLKPEHTLAQINDLVRPRQKGCITALDIRRAGAGEIVYHLLVSGKKEGKAGK